VSRGVTGLCVLLALVGGAAGGVVLLGEDDTVRTETRTVVRRAAAAPAREPRLAAVPRHVGEGRLVLQHLVPTDAEVQESWRLPAAGGVSEQVVVTWARPQGSPQPNEYGLTLWQSEGGAWRRLYRFNAPPFLRNGDLEVHGIGVAVKDVSGDGHLDLLSWQDLGGTAGHGTYRLVITAKGSAREVLRRENNTDDETVGVRAGALIVDRGVRGSEGGPQSIHPGYERWRRTSYRWDGRRLVAVGREVVGLRRHVDPLGS
jgi:hypothetical protein